MQQSSGLLLAAGLDGGNTLICSLGEQMQIESVLPRQKSPIFNRRLAIFTSSLLPIHFSLKSPGDFWKVISNRE